MEHLEQNKFWFSLQQFGNQPIRAAFNIEEKTWYFSIVDVISVLINTNFPQRYWSDLKNKLKKNNLAILLCL